MAQISSPSNILQKHIISKHKNRDIILLDRVASVLFIYASRISYKWNRVKCFLRTGYVISLRICIDLDIYGAFFVYEEHLRGNIKKKNIETIYSRQFYVCVPEHKSVIIFLKLDARIYTTKHIICIKTKKLSH